MRHGATFSVLTLFVIGILNLASCSTQMGAKVSVVQYPLLNHATGQAHIDWRLFDGPDFQVFQGQSKNSKYGGIGIYVGGFPDFHPGENAKIVNDKLGAFPVVWYETVEESPPRFYRAALIEYKTYVTKSGRPESRHTEKIHIWVYGDTRTEMLAMSDYAGGLGFFAQKPPDELLEHE